MNREELLAKATTIIAESGLSDEDKTLWLGQVNGADMNQLELFLAVAEKDVSILGLATESLKKKIAAVNDPDAFVAIVNAENEEITKKLSEE